MKWIPTETRKQSQAVFTGNSEPAPGNDSGGWMHGAPAYLSPLIFFFFCNLWQWDATGIKGLVWFWKTTIKFLILSPWPFMYLKGSFLWYQLPFSSDGKLRTRDHFLYCSGAPVSARKMYSVHTFISSWGLCCLISYMLSPRFLNTLWLECCLLHHSDLRAWRMIVARETFSKWRHVQEKKEIIANLLPS